MEGQTQAVGANESLGIEEFDDLLFGGLEAMETAYRAILQAREDGGDLDSAEANYHAVRSELFSRPLNHSFKRHQAVSADA